MARPLVLTLTLVCGLCVAPLHASSQQTRLAQFLAGCELLNASAAVEPARRAEALRWLIAYTGITPELAQKLIRECRGRPAEWLKITEKMRRALEPLGERKN